MDLHTVYNSDISIMSNSFVIHVTHTSHVVECELDQFKSTFAIDKANLVLLNPCQIGEADIGRDYNLVLAIPLPVGSCEDQHLLCVIDHTVDGQESRVQVEG